MTTQLEKFVRLAVEYHGGQFSPLYSFASMRGDWDSQAYEDWCALEGELRDVRKHVKVGDSDYESLLEFEMYAERMACNCEEDYDDDVDPSGGYEYDDDDRPDFDIEDQWELEESRREYEDDY